MTTAPKPSKSSKPSLPKPPTFLDPSCVISDTALLVGTHLITIGANVILHHRSKIVSLHGPVTIGAGCIISEKCVLGLSAASGEAEPIVLGEDVVLEPGSIVESSIGTGTCIEAGVKVGRMCVVGEHAKVAPLCVLRDGETLGDFEVLFGNGQRRMERRGLERARKVVHDKEVRVLRGLIQGGLAKWQ